jgi:hypothetical protein
MEVKSDSGMGADTLLRLLLHHVIFPYPMTLSLPIESNGVLYNASLCCRGLRRKIIVAIPGLGEQGRLESTTRRQR